MYVYIYIYRERDVYAIMQLSKYLSLYISLSPYLCISLSLSLSISPSVSLSIGLSVYRAGCSPRRSYSSISGRRRNRKRRNSKFGV